jgi:hypothetical protein
MGYNSVILVNHDNSDKLKQSPKTVMQLLTTPGLYDEPRRFFAKYCDEVCVPEDAMKVLPPVHSKDDMFLHVGGNTVKHLSKVSEFVLDGKKHIIIVEEDS